MKWNPTTIVCFFICFGILRPFFENFLMTSMCPPSLFWCFVREMLKNPKGALLLVRQIGPTLGFFGYCKNIFDTLKAFCYFWALDMAPIYAVPGLFESVVAKKSVPMFLKVCWCLIPCSWFENCLRYLDGDRREYFEQNTIQESQHSLSG